MRFNRAFVRTINSLLIGVVSLSLMLCGTAGAARLMLATGGGVDKASHGSGHDMHHHQDQAGDSPVLVVDMGCAGCDGACFCFMLSMVSCSWCQPLPQKTRHAMPPGSPLPIYTSILLDLPTPPPDVFLA